MRASSAGSTAKRARLSSAQRCAWGANVRDAASAMCSGERTGSARRRSQSPGGSSRAEPASCAVVTRASVPPHHRVDARPADPTPADANLMKPWAVLRHANDRELLAQIEAVDAFIAGMHAYPGRTFGQLYHRFFRANDLAGGRLALTGRTLELSAVGVPVLDRFLAAR